MQTMLEYLYRDGGNYELFGEAVFAGEISEAERAAFVQACDVGQYFIASQIGLEDLQPRMEGFYDATCDHVWSEFACFTLTDKPATHGCVHEFVRSVESIVWDVRAALDRFGRADDV